jgi:hypothetical protein
MLAICSENILENILLGLPAARELILRPPPQGVPSTQLKVGTPHTERVGVPGSPRHMSAQPITFLTSHADRSLLNATAFANVLL